MSALPLRLLVSAFVLAGAARAGVVEVVPALTVALAPTPVVLQLQLDLATLNPALAVPSLAPSTLLASIQLAARPSPVAATAPAAPAPAGRAEALLRVRHAQQVLGRYEPGEFAKLPEDRRAAALAELWDGWKASGLVAEPEGPSPADRLVLEGVDDKTLTSANKSIFLGVAVLGYPLDDALWLARTRIQDALDENTLRYPPGQRWMNADHVPEFLGVSGQAQGLVDAWSAAAALAEQIVAQARAGSKILPKSSAASPAAAADFARLAEELLARGDREALDYLAGEDPTFTAFLLDARKPGYYLYNGDASVVGRILKTDAVARMGLRRVKHPDASLPGVSSTYLYRPARVLSRLREVRGEPGKPDSDAARSRLASYIERLAPSAPAEHPENPTAPYSFAEASTLPGSALDSPANQLSSYPNAARSSSRYDLPLPAVTLRARLASGERQTTLDETRWKALARLFKASAALARLEGEVRLVSEPHQTRGRLVAPSADGRGVVIQLFMLDELARLERENPKKTAAFLRFAAAALDGALPSS